MTTEELKQKFIDKIGEMIDNVSTAEELNILALVFAETKREDYNKYMFEALGKIAPTPIDDTELRGFGEDN